MNSNTIKSPIIKHHPPEQLTESLIVHNLNLSEHALNTPFSSAIFTLEAGKSSPPDKHDVSEIWLVLAGSGILRYTDQEFPLTPQKSYCFAPQQIHQAINTSNTELTIFSVYW